MKSRLFLLAGVLALAIVGAVALLGKDGQDTPVPVEPAQIPTPPGTDIKPLEDPFSYDPARRDEFEARAAAGNAHVLFARSPGGVLETAERVAVWRTEVEKAAKAAEVDPDRLEALVFLESAGRDAAIAPQGVEGAVGLTQIVAETGTNLLEMDIDVARSKKLTRQLDRAKSEKQARRLARERVKADPRFDGKQALAATARYLRFARDNLDTDELAFVGYHMGVGNLQNVLRAYAGGETEEPLPYAQVYFDSSPLRNREAYDILYSLGDDSSNYLWKLMAAEAIMKQYRTDPEGLARLQALQTNKNSAEEVLHAPGSVEVFETPEELKQARDAGEIALLPVDTAKTGYRIDPKMGELAGTIDQGKRLYRGLRPEALGMLLYIGAQTRAAAGDDSAALTVTSTVRDAEYQRALLKGNPEATRNYSLHTTGFAFDVLRRYASPKQARAFQFVLDRLTSLNLIAWVREPAAIHVTVSSEASSLIPLVTALGG